MILQDPSQNHWLNLCPHSLPFQNLQYSKICDNAKASYNNFVNPDTYVSNLKNNL